MLSLGTELPDFDLPLIHPTSYGIDINYKSAEIISSRTLVEKPLLIMAICAHCPFVQHIEEEVTRLAKDYRDYLQIIAFSSNSLRTHPNDGPKYLVAQAQKHDWGFPYLFDEGQIFARALKAACTPDFYLFAPSLDGGLRLQYRGQLDDSRPGNNLPVTGEDLRKALKAVLSGRPVCSEQKPSIGCNIKWHPGQEPPWFG